MASTRHLITAATAVLIALPLAACNNDPDPTASPTATAETSTSTPTSGSPTPTASPSAPDQIAYAEAERVYKAFIVDFTDSKKTWDVTKLDQKLITPALYQFFVKDWARFEKSKLDGETFRFTQLVKSIAPAKFVTGKEAQLRVCAVTNARFIDKAGKDITTSSVGGPKAPINKQARSNNIQVLSADGGKTWRINFIAQTPGEGTPC